MIDVDHQLNASRRQVGSRTLEAGEARIVTISQTYDTDVEDLWEACTSPDRLPRWFLPVSGDLRVGGRYQLQGHAGGTIETCDPPHGFTATWESGEQVSGVALRLTPEGDGARLTLEHTVPVDDHWDQFGPGAVGVGWESALVGLRLHLTSGGAVDPSAFERWSGSDDGRRFLAGSSEGWHDADVAGGADPVAARTRADRTAAAYTGG